MKNLKTFSLKIVFRNPVFFICVFYILFFIFYFLIFTFVFFPDRSRGLPLA